jgi:hypothetical protein
MALTMRPTGLSSGFYKDSIDYGVFSGEWCIGRIYEHRGRAPVMLAPARPALEDATVESRIIFRRGSHGQPIEGT